MIKNQQQYEVTMRELKRFEEASKGVPPVGVHPAIRAAQVAAIRGQIEELQDELLEYEARGPVLLP
jgi:hypothetical protein